MKLEEGKFYKTRDGRKAGPITYKRSGYPQAMVDGRDILYGYRENGLWGCSELFGPGPHALDLVEEWPLEFRLEIGKRYVAADGRISEPVFVGEGMFKAELRRSCNNIGAAVFHYNVDGTHKYGRTDVALVKEYDDWSVHNNELPWNQLSDQQKGALLLQHHQDGVIWFNQVGRQGDWKKTDVPSWLWSLVYRAKLEPVVTTEVVYYDPTHGFSNNEDYPYKIVITRHDGEPDVNSIKMEKL